MWFDLMEKLNLICHTIKQPKEKTFIDKIAEFDFKEKLYIKYSAYKMREDIGLYRGKSATTDEWVIGNLLSFKGFSIFDENIKNYITVISNTIGQYIGLCDRNGKKIFEGDICRFREWKNGDMCWIGKVYYKCQQFVISGGENKECEGTFTIPMSRFCSEDIEIIGNIYDNLSLLEEVV